MAYLFELLFVKNRIRAGANDYMHVDHGAAEVDGNRFQRSCQLEKDAVT